MIKMKLIMKLKNILIGIGLITSLQGVQSCIDDRGNYSYISNEELFPGLKILR